VTDFDAGISSTPPPPPRPGEYADVDTRGWWIPVVFGIALVLLGLWVLTNLYDSVVVLAWLVGACLIVAGVLEIVALHSEPGLGWAAWIAGLLLIAGGVVVVAWPDITLWALAVLAGVGIMLAGLVRVVVAFADRDQPDFVINLAIGVVGVVLGALVLAWPEATLTVLAVILGIRFIVSGVVAIGLGWQVHRLGS
jgi:uncharacterized membrane protein HdeD (DUF308 family)